MSTQSPAHLLWASGHLLVLLATLITYFNLFNTPYKSYYLAYLGVILSWAIVVYKSLGVPQPTKLYLRRALMDENVQYLLLALYWFTQVRLHPRSNPFPNRLNSKPNQLDLNSIVIIIKNTLDRNRSFSLYSLSPLFLSFTLVSLFFKKKSKNWNHKINDVLSLPQKISYFHSYFVTSQTGACGSFYNQW